MKRSALLALLLGLIIAAVLLARNDWGQVGATLFAAGWSLLIVILLHLPQTLASAWAWRVLLAAPGPGLLEYYGLRWVRDSINTLLPVAQVGGDVARVRLLARAGGTTLSTSAASAVADVTVEFAAQIVFTLGAILVLVAQPRTGSVSALVWATLLGCAAIAALLIGVRRFGLFTALGRFASRQKAWLALGLNGLQASVTSLFAQPRRVGISLGGHLAAWALGGLETYAALRVIGVPATPGQAMVIEALSHAARAAGFFIPGALGIQEGGYVLVCRIYGIDAPDAVSLSMIKRLRELALGLPGLAVWAWMERRRTVMQGWHLRAES